MDVRRAADIVTRGSIPGAKFFSIAELYSTSGTYVGATVLVKILAAQGIGTADPVVIHCNSSFQAGGVAAVLQRAGFKNLRIYHGSFNEWSSDSSRPIVTY